MPIYKENGKKNGLQKYRVKVYYTDSYGNHKQISKTAYGKDTAAMLERQLTGQVSRQETFSYMTVNQLYEEFIATYSHEIRQSTLRGYVAKFNQHILPQIGNVKLQNLNTKILNDWKNYINAKPLSLVTKQNIFATLRAALNFAVKMEYIPVNPLNKVGNFKDSTYQKPKMKFYTPQEFKAFISAAFTCRQKTGYYDFYVFFTLRYITQVQEKAKYTPCAGIALKEVNCTSEKVFAKKPKVTIWKHRLKTKAVYEPSACRHML